MFPSPLVHRSILVHVYAMVGRSADATAILEELAATSPNGTSTKTGCSACACSRRRMTGSATPRARAMSTRRCGPTACSTPSGSGRSGSLGEQAARRPRDDLGQVRGRGRTLRGGAADEHEHGDAPGIAHTRTDYARMLAARAEPGDAGRALELVGRALDGYRSLGMDGFAAEAAELERAPHRCRPVAALVNRRLPVVRPNVYLPRTRSSEPSRIGWLKTKERR